MTRMRPWQLLAVLTLVFQVGPHESRQSIKILNILKIFSQNIERGDTTWIIRWGGGGGGASLGL